MMRNFFLILAGGSYGLLAAAGVFTVLAAVGLVPRFAGKTHTAEYVLIYEEMVVFGTLTGCVLSVFSRYCRFHAWWLQRAPQHGAVLDGSTWSFRLCSACSPGCSWDAWRWP